MYLVDRGFGRGVFSNTLQHNFQDDQSLDRGLMRIELTIFSAQTNQFNVVRRTAALSLKAVLDSEVPYSQNDIQNLKLDAWEGATLKEIRNAVLSV